MFCPCCASGAAPYAVLSGYAYYRCGFCETIFIDGAVLSAIDGGLNIVSYAGEYWQTQQYAAKQRGYGAALARMAEVFYYGRRPIRKFIDIGTGPGHFLDSVAKYLPEHAHVFYGCEKFPPPDGFYKTPSPNYIPRFLDEVDDAFDAGMCIEVIEHLTPLMLKNLFIHLERTAEENAFFLFNTGMPDYVINENPDYLNPIKNGHIVSYSVKGASALLRGLNLKAFPIPGKTWAFGVEKSPPPPLTSHKTSVNLEYRVWHPVPENMNVLESGSMGSVLKILGMESARAYW